MPLARFTAVTDLLRAGPDAVDFLGLSFHLDSSEPGDRVRAVDECLRLFEQAWAAGLAPRDAGYRRRLPPGLRRRTPAAFEQYGQAVRRGLAGRGRR